MEMSQYHELITFLHGERLREDGSNFISWYLHLRSVLKRANLSFITKDPVGNPPVNNMDEQVMSDYQYRRRTYAMAKSVIEVCIPQNVRHLYHDMDTFGMMDMLKSL